MAISEKLKIKMKKTIEKMEKDGLKNRAIEGLAYFIVSTEHLDGLPVHKENRGKKIYYLYHIIEKKT
ncbi:hypothetical protein K8R62_00385 [bacterium]|nr:hypothetical protein [bacterium]